MTTNREAEGKLSRSAVLETEPNYVLGIVQYSMVGGMDTF